MMKIFGNALKVETQFYVISLDDANNRADL
jgi:hypothetical protein